MTSSHRSRSNERLSTFLKISKYRAEFKKPPNIEIVAYDHDNQWVWIK